DMIARRFIADVAVGRRVSAEHVAARFGQGRTLMATDAKRVGMVDRIAALDDAMGLATTGRTSSATASAAAVQRRRRLETLRQESATADTAADRRRRLELLRDEPPHHRSEK
ncbi:MAG TPA: hypothetical protein VHP59_09920, partial [Vineibacter terrae]|nr:hypothetical protein [Vineibacter terrae]